MTDLSDKPPTAGTVMPGIADQIPQLPFEVRRTARVLADVIGESMWASGKRPSVLATSCLYVADLAFRPEGERYSQRRLCEHAPATHVSVRSAHREIPRVFLDAASEDDRERMHPAALAKIEEMAEIDADGRSVSDIEPADIDPWNRGGETGGDLGGSDA